METKNPIDKDQLLWAKAQKRAAFKNSLLTYLIVNTFLVVIWAIGDRDHFWPMWVLLFWGIGLVIRYIKVYHLNGMISVEKEYQKLRDEK